MHAIIRDSKVALIIPPNTPFAFDDTQYPHHWIDNATEDDKQTLGLVPLTRPISYPDTRFVEVLGEEAVFDAKSNTAAIRYVSQGRPLEQVKQILAAEVNNTAATLLAPSDWMVIRAAEENRPLKPEWSAFRYAVRGTARATVSAIEVAADSTALKITMSRLTWPISPE